jgi:DNA repair protein RadC
LKKALEFNAAAVIFAHNHPSGNKKPSGEDIKITKELSKILGVIDVKVLDHVLVAGNECLSFAEEKLL